VRSPWGGKSVRENREGRESCIYRETEIRNGGRRNKLDRNESDVVKVEAERRGTKELQPRSVKGRWLG